MRLGMLLLGVGLVILWLVGLSAHVPGWMVWLDFIAAIVSFGAAVMPEAADLPDVDTAARGSRRRALSATPFGVALLLFGIWIAGLATGAVAWCTWWNFAFGIGYGLLGVALSAAHGEYRAPYRGPHRV